MRKGLCFHQFVGAGLLVLSGYLFYRAYQLWHRYQEATLNSLTRSIPYAFHIEDYEEFFATHVTAGVVSAVIAVTLFLRRKLGATNTTPSLFCVSNIEQICVNDLENLGTNKII